MKKLRIFNILVVFMGLSNVFMINPYFLEEKNLLFCLFLLFNRHKNDENQDKRPFSPVLNTNEDRFFEKDDIQ